MFSCKKSADNQSASTETTGKVVCVLTDLSESTVNPEIRKIYSENFKTILEEITHGDVLVVGLITQRSVIEPTLCIKYEFSPIVFKHDTQLFMNAELRKANQELKNIKDSLYNIVDSVLTRTNRRILHTDILSSLRVAERVFNSFTRQKRILVILSDMIEDSDTYNFEVKNITPQSIMNIVETEKQNGRMPNLSNVKVYVIGASAKNSKRFAMIQDFWTAYFKESGALLVPENYGAALVSFKE